MNKEIFIGFLFILIIASTAKIFFNYNININIIRWSIDSISVNIYILICSFLIILGLIFIPKYKNNKKNNKNKLNDN